MTEPVSAPAPNDAPVEPAADSLDLPQNLDQAKNLRSENRNLRQRAKAAEEGLEQAASRLAAMQRAEVERLASEHLFDPTDVWRAGTELASYLTEDGTIDPDKVTEAAQAITSDKPHLTAPRKAPPPTDRPIEGLRVGASPNETPTQPTWSGAIGSRVPTGR